MKDITLTQTAESSDTSRVDYAGETAKYSVYGSLIAALIVCIVSLV